MSTLQKGSTVTPNGPLPQRRSRSNHLAASVVPAPCYKPQWLVLQATRLPHRATSNDGSCYKQRALRVRGFEIELRDLEIGIGTEVGFSNRRDVEISPFSVVNRLDEIAPPSAGPNHVRFRIQKAQKVGCDSEISLAFRPAVVG